ncbi:MAG: Fic family protein [Saprospiraceae bacterium]
MQKIKVFLSSVQGEFATERDALYHYILSDSLLGVFFQPFLFEKLPAADITVQNAYLEELKHSDIYIAILGIQYGTENAEGISATEKEYDEATFHHKHRLVFLQQATTRHPKMQQFITKIGLSVIRKSVTTQAELMAGVYASLVHYLMEKGFIQNGPFDATVCRDATQKDIDNSKVRQFVTRARGARNLPLATTAPVKDVLQHLNLLTNGKISNAAILLFGKTPSRLFQNLEIKCASFYGDEVTKPIPSYKIFKGDVFELVDQAVDFVLAKLNLQVGTRQESNQAPAQYEIPRAVVAEAIVNAVAHRDYNSNASVQVMLFNNRLEVWNPGQLPASLSIEQLRGPHGSVPHNPLLAEAMYLAQYIEKLGSGTGDMIRLSVEAGLKEPEFELNDGFKLTVWRLDPKTSPDKYRASTVQVPDKYRASKPEINRLVMVFNGEEKRSELQAKLELKHRDSFMENYLQPSMNDGFVKMTIPDKPNSSKQKYRLTEKGLELKKILEK